MRGRERDLCALTSGSSSREAAEASTPRPSPAPRPAASVPGGGASALVGANDARHWDQEDPETLAARLDTAGIGLVPIELNPALIGRKRGCHMTRDEVRIELQPPLHVARRAPR